MALETLADKFGENRMPIPDSIRHHFERLSTQMTNLERVMRPLGLCPAETDAQD